MPASKQTLDDGGQATGVPTPLPSRQVVLVVQPSPTSQTVPFAFSGVEQMPVAGLYVPALWDGLIGKQYVS